MLKRTPLILLVLLLSISFMSVSLLAKGKYDTQDNKPVLDSRVSNIDKYSFPRAKRELVRVVIEDDDVDIFQSNNNGPTPLRSLGLTSSGSSAASPGITVRATKEDWQYSVKGRYVDFVGSSPSIHFSYTDLQSTSEVDRGFGYNMYNPASGGSWPKGIGIGCHLQAPDVEGRWAASAVYPNGRIVIGGDDAAGGTIDNHFFSNITLHGCFWQSGSQILPTQYKVGFSDTTSSLRYPVIEVQIIGTDTVTHIIGHEHPAYVIDPSAPALAGYTIQYFRRIGTGQMLGTTVWTGPTTIDTARYRGVIAASKVSSKVAVAYNHYTPLGFVKNQAGDCDVFYRESTDGGLTWGPPTNITNYDRNVKSYSPWIEVQPMYDSQNFLHVIWNGSPWPAGVYDSASFFFGDFSTSLFHWTDRNNAISRVANRDYGLEWNSQVCGMGGTNTNYLAFFNIAECNGRMYVTYSGWNDVFGDGEIDDCASSFFDADSRVWQANAEVYMHVSTGMDGQLWDAARNLTNSKSPGCDSAGFGGECMNDTKLMMARYGYDSASYGQALTFPGSELLVVDPGYTGSQYLNLFYLIDRIPGNAAIGRGTIFSDNPLNWIRTGCIDPITASAIAYSPTSIGYPSYTPHGASYSTTITVVNDGNTTLTGTIGTAETSGPAGWLTISTSAINVNAGSGNTMTYDVLINANLNINSPGTIIALNGEAYMLSNAPAPRDSVSFKINNFLVADTVVGLQWDTVATTSLQLIVSSNGEMGRNGATGVNLDFTGLALDCDSSAEVYLYSGGPFVIRADAVDTTITYAMHTNGFAVENAPKPVIGFATPGSIPTTAYDHYESGSFVNWDTTIMMEKSYYAPLGGADSSDFMIQCLKVYSADGNAHNNLTIGELIDWDIPTDVASNNDAFALTDGKTVYFQGIDDTSTTDCQDNALRQGAQSLLGWYTSAEYAADSCSNNRTLYGSYAARNDSDLFLVDDTNYAGFLWNKTLSLTGATGKTDGTDLHGVVTFVHGYDLGANDTLTFYSVLTTVKRSDSTNISDNIGTACEWFDQQLRFSCGVCGCCVGMTGNVDNDPGEIVDIGDLTALIGFLFIPPNTPPVCMEEANTDGDLGGVVDIGDLTALIGFLFIPPNTPPAACQ